jgi:hypothetical protein
VLFVSAFLFFEQTGLDEIGNCLHRLATTGIGVLVDAGKAVITDGLIARPGCARLAGAPREVHVDAHGVGGEVGSVVDGAVDKDRRSAPVY